MVQIYSVTEGRLIDQEPIEKSESTWKAILDPITFEVARRGGTEPPFTGRYHNCHLNGIYLCACCETDLFYSEDKFDSGTGWPSFTKAVSENNIHIKVDRSAGMIRDEVLCALCGAHLGHVFNDGPPPAGRRFCMNSASLRLRSK
ncbi:peptide-methionine (R)-S-oxide reductase MsrB [Methanocalculus taiwanensis]|uniref:peptide-methionine (R)-S-oxide reductase n=1 Tax=Methanocalculus taiwanensis TaxID=106207 RepID=A0ABD4TKB6_9EURY|nr:peptide-methionine (R)-S-oxide reductase MsrB [Methanocalculus taiwanensis]MCQ1537780.1 peptide-methionine (R)-S-oxide reductase MsrB [Methanocalculus taiwanensis]